MIHILCFRNCRYNFKINFIAKTIENYMSLNNEQPKEVIIDQGFPLAFTNNFHFK